MRIKPKAIRFLKTKVKLDIIMKKIFLILLALPLALMPLQAQSYKAFMKAANEAFNSKDYYSALNYYQVLLQADSQRTDIRYKFAESARQFDAYKLAEENYEKVATANDKSAFPLNDYWLASVKKSLGKYAEAKDIYQRFLSGSSDFNASFNETAQKEITNCDWALDQLNTPDEGVNIVRLKEQINSDFTEFAPYLVGDDLYYSTMRFDPEDDDHDPPRKVAKVLKNTITAENAESDEVDLKGHAANTAFNKDGSRMYFTKCDYVSDSELRCAIYYKNKKGDGSWNNEIKLSETVNLSGYTATQPNIAYDASGQELLYFVSDRPDGKGKLDIWSTTCDAEGNFTTPINVAAVNSENDDITPFYHSSTQTLYFSSNGYRSLGGYDVYKKVMDNTGSAVEHLSAPTNSSYNDVYYFLNEAGTEGYLSSNRAGSLFIESEREACCNDIYKVMIECAKIDLMALVFDAETKESLVGAKVELLEVSSDGQTEKVNTEGNDFDFPLDCNKEYKILVSREGYEPVELPITTINFKGEPSIKENIYLKKKVIAVDLIATTFENGLDLTGATVELFELGDNGALKSLDKKYNVQGNDFDFDLDPNKKYKIVVSKPDYDSVTVEFNTLGLKETTTINKEINLKKLPPKKVLEIRLSKYLPMPLYFDNDQPDSRTTRTYTTKTYGETYQSYYARKGEFESKLAGAGFSTAQQNIANFFETKVRPGNEGINAFTEHLIKYLEQGNTAELMVKGFASPRAKSDYNVNLTKRRISSVRNHFRNYRGGILTKYFNSGQLKVTEKPFGESAASTNVSDSDQINSIFSVEASLERRVEIIEIKY